MIHGLARCKDCDEMFDILSMQGEWCEECFEKGLHKDMNDHWENYWREEMAQELPSTTPERPGDE